MNTKHKNHDQQNVDATAFALDQLSSDSADRLRQQISGDVQLQKDVNESVRLAGLVEHANAVDLPKNISGLEQQMEEAFAQASSNKVVKTTHLATSGWSGRRFLAIAATTLLIGGGSYLLVTSERPREVADNQVPPVSGLVDELSRQDALGESGVVSQDGLFDFDADDSVDRIEELEQQVDVVSNGFADHQANVTVLDNGVSESELKLHAEVEKNFNVIKETIDRKPAVDALMRAGIRPDVTNNQNLGDQFSTNIHSSAGPTQYRFGQASGSGNAPVVGVVTEPSYNTWGPKQAGGQQQGAGSERGLAIVQDGKRDRNWVTRYELGGDEPDNGILEAMDTLSLPSLKSPDDLRNDQSLYGAKGMAVEREKVAKIARIQQLEKKLQLAQQDHKLIKEADVFQFEGSRTTRKTKTGEISEKTKNRLAVQDKLVAGLQNELRQLTEDVAVQRTKVTAMTAQAFHLKNLEGKKKSLEQLRENLLATNDQYGAILEIKDTGAMTQSRSDALSLHQAKAGELAVKLENLNRQIVATQQTQKFIESSLANGAEESEVMDWIINQAGRPGADAKQIEGRLEVSPHQPIHDEINRLEVIKSELSKKYGAEHSEVKTLDEKIAGMQLWLKSDEADADVAPEEKIRRFQVILDRQVSQLNSRFAGLSEEQSFHKERAAKLQLIDSQLAARQREIDLIRTKMQQTRYQPVCFYYSDYRDRDPDTRSSEQYELPPENPFQRPVGELARSTFSIDVDTASYANARRFINNRQLPPANAVRVEEFINYFAYDYATPTDGKPFAVNMEVASCPWNQSHKLLRVGIKGKEVPQDDRPPSNLVFLIDVSGSMADQNKLPLLQRSMLMLVDKLTENDRVTIVTYAGNAGLRMEPASGDQKDKIRGVISGLASGGSTHGSAGIRLAYEKATQNFIPEGTNRVILATDGDLNVGVTADDELVRLIKDKAETGVFLSVLGFGTGNLKDARLEKLADNGNGQYSYIDSIREARKVLVEDMTGSLITIAKDVKIQIEFNPARIAGYRLIGYENRTLQNQDFDNDLVDAGEIGAGHTVTALYELIPVGGDTAAAEPEADTPLKYQQPAAKTQAGDAANETESKLEFELTEAARSGELVTLALRYKEPETAVSTRVDFVVEDGATGFEEASQDLRFAASVASYGMLLRHSRHAGSWRLDNVENAAALALGEDSNGHRAEFIDLVRQTRSIVGH